MSRVIRDSDDESDGTIEEDLEDVVTKTASSSRLGPTPQPPEGTSSTDSLQKAFQAAHRAQFESQPDESLPSVPTPHEPSTSNKSVPQNPNKRRKIAADAPMAESPGMTSPQEKPQKTDGGSKPPFSSPFLEQLQGQTLPAYEAGTANNDWGLEGTIRQDYAHHEPNELFPEPSSTVANTTLTQERLLAEVMHPGFLFEVPEEERYQPKQSSIPWSDYLRSQSSNTKSQQDLEASHEQASSRQEGNSQTARPDNDALHPPPVTVSQTPRLSQHSQRGSSGNVKGSPLENDLNPQNIADPIPDTLTGQEGLVSSHFSTSRSNQTTSAPARRTSLQKDAKQMENARSHHPTKTKRASSPPPVPPSDEYLEDLGLPKEQYKPRASRSRSGKAPLEEPADYSVRPEKSSRRAPRRSKTTGGVVTPTFMSTPEKVEQIIGMGFDVSATQRALERQKGDVGQAINWLLTSGPPKEQDEQDELAPPRVVKSRSKSQKSGANTNLAPISAEKETITSQKGDHAVPLSAPAEATENLAPTKETPDLAAHAPKTTDSHEHRSPTQVRVVIPRSVVVASAMESEEQPKPINTPHTVDTIGNAPTRKAKRKKTTVDVPDSVEENETRAVPAPVKKKQTRGRPKKEPVSVPSVSHKTGDKDEDKEAQTSETLQSEEVEPQNLESKNAGPQQVQSKDVCTRGANKQTKHTAPSAKEKPALTPPPNTPNTTTSAVEPTTKTPEEQTKPATDTRLPLSQGKSTYRVGLSKRARIAPLLKIVKK